MENIDIDIDIDKDILENIDIDIDIDKQILENIDIDIDIDKDILENIDIDKDILENIDIDKISNRLEFGISNRASCGGTVCTLVSPLRCTLHFTVPAASVHEYWIAATSLLRADPKPPQITIDYNLTLEMI